MMSFLFVQGRKLRHSLAPERVCANTRVARSIPDAPHALHFPNTCI